MLDQHRLVQQSSMSVFLLLRKGVQAIEANRFTNDHLFPPAGTEENNCPHNANVSARVLHTCMCFLLSSHIQTAVQQHRLQRTKLKSGHHCAHASSRSTFSHRGFVTVCCVHLNAASAASCSALCERLQVSPATLSCRTVLPTSASAE